MGGLNTGGHAAPKEALKAFVSEACNHTFIVTRGVTRCNLAVYRRDRNVLRGMDPLVLPRGDKYALHK